MPDASPLAVAMLSGAGAGNPNMMLMDPALLAAQPELQLGQGMMAQGLSSAPAYPAQALARVIQAGLGTSLYGGAISDLAKAYGGVSGSLESVFPPNTPIGQALRSNNPMVRMMAVQEASKVMALNSARFELGPGAESHAAGSTTPTSVSGAPQSEPGKVVSDAQRAAGQGNAPAAEAIGRAITKETSTPEGVQFPPTQVVPRPTGAGTTPGVAVPPPQTAPAGTSEAIAEAKAEQERKTKIAGGAGEALGKEIGGVIEAGGKAARDKINTMNAIEDALNQGGDNIATGPFAEHMLRAKQALDGMGIDTSWIKPGLAESEVIQKLNAQLASAAAKALTGRPSQFEFATMLKNNPGLLTSKDGTHSLISILRQTAQQDIKLGRLAQNKANWENWGEVTDKFYADPKNQIISPFTQAPMATGPAPKAQAVPSLLTARGKNPGDAPLYSRDGGKTWTTQ